MGQAVRVFAMGFCTIQNKSEINLLEKRESEQQ